MKFDWDEVWNRKGASDSEDHVYVSGFENTVLDSARAAAELVKLLEIKPEDTVLEIGAGAGVLARHFHMNCHYVATDKSELMVKKTIALNGWSAVTCEANDIIFKDKTFDKVYAFGVFHYFPDHEYARKVLQEMLRIAKVAVSVCDVPRISHDDNHLLYQDSFFDGWEITEGFYTERRFNATKFLR